MAVASASLALLLVDCWSIPRSLADSVELVNGEVVKGMVESFADGKVKVDVIRNAAIAAPEDKLFSAILKTKTEETKTEKAKTSKDGAAQNEQTKPPLAPLANHREIPLTDVVQIRFDPIFDRARHTPPLIDNDGAASGRSLSGTIKLRAGYHRMALPYWHGTGRQLLRLAYSWIDGKSKEHRQRFVRGDMLVHLGPACKETPSTSLDKEGYRLPETLTGTVAPNVLYTLRRQPDGRPFKHMRDILSATSVVGNGSLDRITTRQVADEDENVAMLIAGYFRVPQDGAYEFQLTSDGGSQLYIGETPGGLQSIDAAAAPAEWALTLVDDGVLRGTIESWSDAKIALRTRAGKSPIALSIPTARVKKVWSSGGRAKVQPAKEEQVDPGKVPANQDVVFARSAAGPIQQVPGRIQGIQGESLILLFGGESRKIALSKVAGMILASDGATEAADQTFHQLAETYSGMKVSGQVTALDLAALKLRTSWGETVTLETDDLTSLSVKNGKIISLTDLKPEHVEQVPFFERMIRYQMNQSLSGGPILLRDGKHARGISVHAKTVLRYAIGGRFQRFRVKVGFQLPEGELGDAAISVLGDNKNLYTKPSFRGEAPVEPLDIDVSGVGTLTLVVDFGHGQDVGDRVVWADPMLIRGEVGPVANSAERAEK